MTILMLFMLLISAVIRGHLSVPGYKLLYFYVRGKAQIIRYLLEDNAIPYEEEFVTGEIWASLKPKMMFGQIPRFQDGDFELFQSPAILRYLARKHGLYGTSAAEAALVDMVHECQIDLRTKFMRMLFSKDKYEEERDIYLKNLPTELEKIEKLLEKNNGGQGFFVGNQISYADYSMFDLLSNNVAYQPECFISFPLLQAFVTRMAARENLVKYMASDVFKNMKITGSGHL